jgi:hypothetical protein
MFRSKKNKRLGNSPLELAIFDPAQVWGSQDFHTVLLL